MKRNRCVETRYLSDGQYLGLGIILDSARLSLYPDFLQWTPRFSNLVKTEVWKFYTGPQDRMGKQQVDRKLRLFTSLPGGDDTGRFPAR